MSHNKLIIQEFYKLIEQAKKQIYSAPEDEKRKMIIRYNQLNNIKDIIKKYPKKINKGEDIENIFGIGKGTVKRINEIIKTGKLSEIHQVTLKDKELEEIKELTKIHGIGKKLAEKLVKEHDIHSIDELMENYSKGKLTLNKSIEMGIKYHNIYQQNIPRKEIQQLDLFLQNVVRKQEWGKHLEIIICGSYRRMEPISNDIDIVVIYKNKDRNYFELLINYLKNISFIVDDLTENYKSKYMGYCRLNYYPTRRIDIRYIFHTSRAPAILYFTGSKEFNKYMRGIAKKKNYRLNEYYLIDSDNNKIVKTEKEKDIFEKLGIEYVPPHKR